MDTYNNFEEFSSNSVIGFFNEEAKRCFSSDLKKFNQVFESLSALTIYHHADIKYANEATKAVNTLKKKSLGSQELLVNICCLYVHRLPDNKLYVSRDSKREDYQKTFDEFFDKELNENKYKEKTLNSKNALNSFKKKTFNDWVNLLIKKAKDTAIPDRVLDSYIDLMGEKALYAKFRGESEYGISFWRPKEIRLYDKSYQKVLKNKKELGLSENVFREYKDEVSIAIEDNEDVPLQSFMDIVDKDAVNGIKSAYNAFFAEAVEQGLANKDLQFFVDRYGSFGYLVDGEKRFAGDDAGVFAYYDSKSLDEEVGYSKAVSSESVGMSL